MKIVDVRIVRGLESGQVWELLHLGRGYDGKPLVQAVFNVRAALKGYDFTHWGETRKTNG